MCVCDWRNGFWIASLQVYFFGHSFEFWYNIECVCRAGIWFNFLLVLVHRSRISHHFRNPFHYPHFTADLHQPQQMRLFALFFIIIMPLQHICIRKNLTWCQFSFIVNGFFSWCVYDSISLLCYAIGSNAQTKTSKWDKRNNWNNFICFQQNNCKFMRNTNKQTE